MKKLFFILYILPVTLFGQQWYQLGNGFLSQYHTGVFNITEYQNKIIAGGNFKKAGNLIVNGIAQWNNINWENLTKGIWWDDGASPDSVGGAFDFSPYRGNLYCGGTMSGAGGNYIGQSSHYAYNIARWNGADWFPLSPPPPMLVLVVLV